MTGVKLTVGSGKPVYVGEGSIGSEKREAYVIDNLKRQVALLEADNTALRDVGGGKGTYSSGGAEPVGVDGTIRKLRSDYERNEGAHAAREGELNATAERYRKEALSAKLRERNAIDEMADAKEHLTEQREKFAAARQELTAEVIAYQRDLDNLAHEKRQLAADLADAQRELNEREDFMQGFDARVRLLEAQLTTKGEECVRAMKATDALRTELGEERAQAASLRDKYEMLKSHQNQVEDMRGSFVDEATEANAELKRVKIELEQEQHARRLADDAKNYLVVETSKLEGTIKELSATAEFISQENGRLKADSGQNKVMKVVGRFMIRKMREKLGDAQASEAAVRANEASLNHRFVRAEQKCVAIERELMLLRRRAAEREAAFEQQRSDASDLSVENRMLLEKTEQMTMDAQRSHAKREALNAKNIELSAELDLMRERHEVLSALGKFNPEDLANVSRTNAALASSIQALLPKLDTKKPDLGGEPLSSSGLSAPIFPSTQMV